VGLPFYSRILFISRDSQSSGSWMLFQTADKVWIRSSDRRWRRGVVRTNGEWLRLNVGVLSSCFMSSSLLPQVRGRGAISLPYRLYYVEGCSKWYSPHVIMGTIKPDTPFIQLLLLRQQLLCRTDRVRTEHEMSRLSTSTATALSGRRRKDQDGETA
jgi:hypothetical protein